VSRSAIACLCGLLQPCVALPAAAQFVPVRGRECREVFNPTNPVRGETSTVISPASASLGRTELELAVLQEAVGPTLKTLLDAAPCQ